MKVSQWMAGICLLGTLGVAQAEARPDPDLARNLAATCANCHGTNGRAVQSAGNEELAGVPKDKLMQKLRDFRSGAKPATIMHQISKGYTEAQLELVAAYFAAQK
ncbi:MAG: hypothetical protein RLZZ220_1999 [Pseudomonadota bacterium]|jgi:sulfide dehydrogenase cytochrome subunit|uniref:Cytochrome c domain-containing protein n=1 Tax=Zoogloea ramigera TaxID=350 RepID=A0A4Y4CTB7_ZOORA|nr:cytochrome C [Zoogloea ramigera]MBP6802046.1 cytochrome C [Zoogloea sp.]MBP7627437.1 cytochrome C [Zoogloea sp.]GEC95322.1 hypothetical protein ZRA01_13950 [Zoogloea ramigera]